LVPLILIVMACGAVIYYGHQLASTMEQSITARARVDGQLTAREITGFLDREHERLRAFVAEKETEVREILAFPDNWPAIDALQTSLQRMFRGALAFTVTGADGKPMFEDFEGLVGPVCQASMRDYVQSMGQGLVESEIPPVHPVPGAHHFDLISPWKLESGESGLFFVSMSPGRIAELLDAAQQASGARMLLVNRDDPTLIEVAASGARDTLGEAIRLQPEALTPGHFIADLPGTQWRLVVLPDRAALTETVNGVYARVALLVLALLLISIILLVFIRRSEQRNSSVFMRSLQSSLSRQRAILQSMVDGMATIDSKGKILHVNNAITGLFGYQPKELIGSNVRMLMPEPDRSAHDGYLRNYLNTGESKILGKGREVLARHKDGRLFPVLLTLGEAQEGDERIFVGILHDMTAYKDAQRKIVSQALAIERSKHELEEISQIASRDLQMPLQRITSLGESLESGVATSLSGSEKDQLKSLADDARNVSELVKGLADYTRVERESAAQPVDLDSVLDDVRDDLATLIGSTGASVTVAPLGQVLGNPKQVRQLFWNLVENALKFRDSARKPEISVSLAADEEVPADQVVVLVRDNGMGIPEDQCAAVFEAFRRLLPRDTYPGAGLGLSFCRKIVEGMGGQISVSSTLGEGSTFRVTLPKVEG
jgi:PAS domain S-box-containing protein